MLQARDRIDPLGEPSAGRVNEPRGRRARSAEFAASPHSPLPAGPACAPRPAHRASSFLGFLFAVACTSVRPRRSAGSGPVPPRFPRGIWRALPGRDAARCARRSRTANAARRRRPPLSAGDFPRGGPRLAAEIGRNRGGRPSLSPTFVGGPCPRAEKLLGAGDRTLPLARRVRRSAIPGPESAIGRARALPASPGAGRGTGRPPAPRGMNCAWPSAITGLARARAEARRQAMGPLPGRRWRRRSALAPGNRRNLRGRGRGDRVEGGSEGGGRSPRYREAVEMEPS
jgi:hypothetical protein